MEVESVYKYFRPVMLLCYLLGHFPVVNVTSRSAKDLELKRNSLTFIISITAIAVIVCLDDVDVLFSHEHPAFVALNVVWGTAIYFVSTWISFRANDIIEGIKTLDKLPGTLASFPSQLRPRDSAPMISSITMVASFVASILLPVGICLNVLPLNDWILDTLYCLYILFTIYRQCLVLSYLLYSCSMVVEDVLKVWECYCWANCRPFHQIHDFSESLMSQTEYLRELDEILRRYVLVFFCCGVCDILCSVVYFTNFSKPITTMVINTTYWNVYLGLLVISAQLSSNQYDKYAREVLEMAVRDMTWRDYVKVRVLLSQLEDSPGEFTAAGFFKVKPELILAFLSFGIDYIIFFAQNLSELQEIARVSELSTVASSNSTV